LRLVGSLALTFFGLTVITFCLSRVLPIDPVLAVVGDRAPTSPTASRPRSNWRPSPS
jgi:peptide/nickel transport system permease protein